LDREIVIRQTEQNK